MSRIEVGDQPADCSGDQGHWSNLDGTDEDKGGCFRRAMRGMAATATILSTRNLADRAGIIATSVISVSMEPPALLVCVNQQASIHAPLLKVGMFCVNVLSEGQAGLLLAFASSTDNRDRFLHGNWREHRDIPYLEPAQANIFCAVDKRIDYATHTIVVGRVTWIRLKETVAPLIYLNGGPLSYDQQDRPKSGSTCQPMSEPS